MSTEQHGDVRGQGVRTTFSQRGNSALTITTSQTFCQRHGWLQTDGIFGSLAFRFDHADCAVPVGVVGESAREAAE